ncbi:MAG TPA: pyridoxamine 5'-phosphate oxidase [Candidatus Hydrogenedentes bacterium]|nr:pyridoxamine 5'-phosphate oxidase [Candidatus Hydrogenedentota bacterium]HOJ68195.1 pyridoxamine 5'-phosphate oxidase [Candidatus Hydrogenedentota bacterium]HOK88787.1 pyridoxamine 5'-phosphate oxidase [Candidatus Hydrogenedentota bacterium]
MQTIPNEPDPFSLFAAWYAEAAACKAIDDHTAVALGTCGADGQPDVRMVLLKGYDERGFVFYTNLGSPKARQLNENPRASLCFYWMPLEKQVRVRGSVESVTDEEADAYFASRPRQSQIGAWASKQSQPLEGRYELEKRIIKYGARFALGSVPRPPFWSGFRLRPNTIEFWLKMPYRLHDRLLYTRTASGWEAKRLFP